MKTRYLIAIVFCILIFGISGTGYPDYIKTTIIDIETHKGRYIVNTDNGTYKNVDNYLFMKFSSSDLAGEIKKLIGKEVKIKKVGWRIPLFSYYENILSVELAERKE